MLFPGAGYIELAFAAGQIALGKGTLDIENFEILRPLAIPAHGDPIIQTYVNVKDGEVEISSRADRDAADWLRHARGRLSRTETRVREAAANLAEISSRMPHAVSAEEHYAGSSNRGLNYGPNFQGVSKILLTVPTAEQREALAEIHLSSLETGGTQAYLAHPSLLDSCVQVIIALIGQNDKRNCSTIPVYLGRVRSLAPLTSRLFCHVMMRRESASSAVADFRVMDQDGNLLLTIDEARCQKVDFGHSAASPLTSEWWRPDPAAAPLAAPAQLPAPSEIRAGLTAKLEDVERQNARANFYQHIRPQFDRLVGAYAARAIAALEPGGGLFDSVRLARRAGVKRDQTGLLTKLIHIAEQDGQLLSSGSMWRWNNDRVPECPDAIWRELFQNHPSYYAELLLLAEAGDTLAARMRREEAGEFTAALLDQLLDTSPYRKPYNQMVRATVEKLVASWPADRPLRILEIGGAGGGLAAWILPILPSQRADYLFTDPSEAAVAHAEHRLSAHRFARFATLDLTRDFVEQGQPAGYFDLVISSASYDSASDSSDLLDHLRAVMTGDGLLLAIHANQDRFTDLVLDRNAASQPANLAEAGFENGVALDDSGACPPDQKPQQSVFLSQRSSIPSIPPAELPPPGAGHWMLVFEDGDESNEFSAGLAQALLARGQNVTTRPLSSASTDLKAEIESGLGHDSLERVVFVAAIVNQEKNFLATQTLRTLNALHLTQALETMRRPSGMELTFVTRGAFPTASGQGPLDPGQAPLWGLGRVIGNEHSALNIRLVDLHSSLNNAEDAAWLAAELLRRDAETEVQISTGHRYVNRERLNSLTDEARIAGAASPEAFALDFQARGGLDSLYLRTAERKTPAPDQVEIAVQAAGLNFRDVLWAIGMLPEEAVEKGFSGPTIGMECAGQIVRVGANVTSLKPGDRVVAFASNCFASHVTTDARVVATIPDELDFSAAATIPTAFLTAYYAFDYLARLEKGETVLIHGAAGGVGMAAIQIAKLKGAKVIGTAGSPRKRRMLELLGVDHVLNSRSLEFADDVMKITGGVGVDVVLNSLAGEAITKGLNCLRPFGRFLEIGKRDLYANSHIGLRPFRNNLSYFGIDADTLIGERPELACSIFKTIMSHFASGELRPLPFQAVPVSRAVEAFRSMQQSKHVGKLVVSMQLDTPASLPVVASGSIVRPGVTYLVTGGLGGFGLATAEWLAAQGATSLALIGRSGVTTEAATAGVARIERVGVTVRTFAADIADGDALAKVLLTVRSEMAPLKGIIHSAAVIEDAPILNLGAEQLERVFRPKLLGAWNLHEATLHDNLEMFVLYSSSSAVVGNPGQGAYVAANLYLDALALYRKSLGLPALSIGWGAIKDAGFLTRHQAVAGMLKSRTGLDATPAHEALAELGRLSAVGATRVSVGRFDLQRLSQMLPGARVPRFLPIVPKGVAASLQAEETLTDLLKKTPEAEQRALILTRVREHAARVLGTSASQIKVDQPLAELGLDSLMAVELAGGLERDLGQPVAVMQMLSAGSLASIAELVMKMLGANLASEANVPPAANESNALQESKA